MSLRTQDQQTYGLQSHPSMKFVYLDRKLVLDPLHLFVLVCSASDSSESAGRYVTHRQILSHTLQLIANPRIGLLLRFPLVLDMHQCLFQNR